MADDDKLKPKLWTKRPVEETLAVYRDWAETYDAEVEARGYRTPARIAAALAKHVAPEALILDFGCGTGLSGRALRGAGFTRLHGTDITAEMLEKAEASGLYEKTWVGTPGEVGVTPGTYRAIVAAGVVSLGAAPPETLEPLVKGLAPGDILAFSYNEPTLGDRDYIDALDAVVRGELATILSQENGPHLEDVGMTSDVILLRRL